MTRTITFLIALMLLTINTFACVCYDWVMFPPVGAEHLDEEEYQIFIGEVIDIQVYKRFSARDTTDSIRNNYGSGIRFNQVTISVIKNYGQKVIADTIVVLTGTSGGLDCGFPFKKKQKYLITVPTKDKDQDYYYTSICLPTKRLSMSKEDQEFIENNRS
ncbi:MAG: hypothetical protein AAGI38_22505 [Bacteroidota bacterium]